MADAGTTSRHASPAPEPRGVRYVTPAQLHDWMQQEPAPVVLDVRREEGYALQPVQIPGALRFSLDTRPPAVPALPRGTPLVVY